MKVSNVRIDQFRCMSLTSLRELRDEISLVIKEKTNSRRFKIKSDINFDAEKYEQQRQGYIQDTNKEIVQHNSNNILKPLHIGSVKKMLASMPYLPALINQDWSSIYPEKENDTNTNFYVYAHVDPSKTLLAGCDKFKCKPFYIGKGCGDRAYDLKRNQGHGKILDSLKKAGIAPSKIVVILYSGLSESKAFEIESKLISFFGTVYSNPKGILYNLDIPKTPKYVGMMKKMRTYIRSNEVEHPSVSKEVK